MLTQIAKKLLQDNNAEAVRVSTVDATSYTLVGMLLRDGTGMECLVDPTELEDSAVLGTAQYGDKRCTVLQLRNGERVLYL